MISLARKTLLYEWRRYLPATLSVSFAGLLLLIQAALVYGIFGAAAIYITQSSADLWVGHAGTESFDLGRPIPADTKMKLLMDPDIERVEPFQFLSGDWRGPKSHGTVAVLISGIDPQSSSMMFDQSLSPSMRRYLYEPGSIIIDQNDLHKLGLGNSNYGSINNHRVHIVGKTVGIGALGGVNVLTSLATAKLLSENSNSNEMVSYYGVKIRHGNNLFKVKNRLRTKSTLRMYEVWTQEEFAQKTMLYWLFDTGAGLGVLFLAIIVLIVGVVITSQTLMAAVAACLREYATLQALGVGFNELRKVVLEQAAWIGGLGIVLGDIFGAAVLIAANKFGVPVKINTLLVLTSTILVMMIVLISGLLSVRTLHHVDPANLLR
ncbi:MAG TPA: FtsX-like permease family protein [Gammaproteobacteria bacterium]|nr:FtsX-like permease family protein [Gammaproteobacteria bacterium]